MISTELKKLVDPKNECCCEYHLAYKCKVWAFDKGYSVYATQNKIDDGEWCIYVFKDKDMHDYGCDICDTTFKTEIDAILKACEWIMEQTK